MAVAGIPVCVKAFKEAVSNLGLTIKLYAERENALFHFLSRENVFVNLPTSYGKSMIFQIAPLVASELSKSCTQFEAHCIIIVISPLVAVEILFCVESHVFAKAAKSLKASEGN